MQPLGVIPIQATDVPCAFSIKLQDRTYRMEWQYNETGDFFTVNLAITGSGEELCFGEILRYGKPLFEQFNDEKYPLPVIVPLCPTGEQISAITYENFGQEVQLLILPRPEG